MLPSAFQIINFPVNRSFELVKSGGCKAFAGYLFGVIALPLNIALTPVTIIADVIIGLAEALFAYTRNNPTCSAGDIAWKKIIASPTQQITYFFVTTLCYIPVITLLFWGVVEGFAEAVVSSLPDTLNHNQLNIFYHGGMKDVDTNAST